MTGTAPAPAYTLEDAKQAVLTILGALAGLRAPDTYECGGCETDAAGLVTAMCPDHACDDLAVAELGEAAVRVCEAQTVEGILAAVIAATGRGDE